MLGILTIVLLLPALLTTALERDGRIIGGSNARSEAYPYQVAILYHGVLPICGGSIIATKIILTAAHCDLNNVANYKVLAGSLSYKNYAATGQLRSIESYLRHESYQNAFKGFDIALAKVNLPFVFNNYVKRITMSTTGATSFAPVTATGWGLTRSGDTSSTPEFLQTVEMRVISKTECILMFGSLPPNVMCAAAPFPTIIERGTCQGDSGGPIVQKQGSEFMQVGITSYGPERCAAYYGAGVYTAVENYNAWISKAMRLL